jgi:hypothetical protein
MNVYFDDVRNAPDNSWEIVREPEQLKDLLVAGVVQNLSLDHDLGEFGERGNGRNITGYDILTWMEETNHLPKGRIFIHSQNPVGRMKMLVVIQRLGKGQTMSRRTVKTTCDTTLFTCDWCGKELTGQWPTFVDTIKYMEEYEGNHGRMSNREEEIHICSNGSCKAELHNMMRQRKR